MAHAAESAHWYTRSGEVAYTVKAKAGHERPTTLADARKLNLVPSVTTVLQCAYKPALERWKVNQAILAALTLPRLENEQEAAYLQRIMQDSQEQARKAAERGTAIHAAIQGHFEGEPPVPDLWPYVQGAAKAINGAFDYDQLIPEKSFACRLGFGGKVDLSSFDHSAGYILDFKTKEFTEKDDMRTWDEHAMQLAAYREGLGYPDADCGIVYVSTTVPGLARLLWIEQAELKKGWKCFYSLLQFWKAKNNLDTSFERLAA